MDTIRYGDLEVPIIHMPWRSSSVAPAYPELKTLPVAEHWSKARLTAAQGEHMPIIDGTPVLAGIAIATLIIEGGADWACASEAWSNTYFNPDGFRIEVSGAPRAILDQLLGRGGRVGGMPDAWGIRGDTVILREAKRTGNDRVRSNQHEFVRRAVATFGDRLDIAVVDWDAPI